MKINIPAGVKNIPVCPSGDAGHGHLVRYGGDEFIMIIKNGLMLMGISTAYQEASEGLLLVLAIALQMLMNKRTR